MVCVTLISTINIHRLAQRSSLNPVGIKAGVLIDYVNSSVYVACGAKNRRIRQRCEFAGPTGPCAFAARQRRPGLGLVRRTGDRRGYGHGAEVQVPVQHVAGQGEERRFDPASPTRCGCVSSNTGIASKV